MRRLLALTLTLAACSSPASPLDLRPSSDARLEQRVPDAPLHEAGALEARAPDRALAPDAGAACPLVGYQPCGGDLTGTWNVLRYCPEDPAAAQALFEHPYDDLAQCQRPENPVSAVRSWSGTVAFAAGLVTLDIASSVAVSYGFTDACLAAARPGVSGAAAQCAALATQVLSCTYQPGLCTCTGVVPYPDEKLTEPWSASGSDLSLAGEQATYCVSGKGLVIDFKVHPVSWRWWVLERP